MRLKYVASFMNLNEDECAFYEAASIEGTTRLMMDGLIEVEETESGARATYTYAFQQDAGGLIGQVVGGSQA